jgi:hypothetical protein
MREMELFRPAMDTPILLTHLHCNYQCPEGIMTVLELQCMQGLTVSFLRWPILTFLYSFAYQPHLITSHQHPTYCELTV